MKNIALLIGLCLVMICLAKPPVKINPLNPKDPPKLPKDEKRNVLIVGGGLAGLSAALELAERGYNVTIKEKESYIGGKLFCKPVQVFKNETYFVEHGFHAWFHNYHQFKDIRNRLKLNENFREWAKVNFIYRNYKPEVIYSEGPYPFNLIGIIKRSPNLKLTDVLLSILSMPDLMFFDYDTVFDKYDNITFRQWATEKKVQQDFYDIIMQPALSVTLNEKTIFSAAEMLTFMQIYFLSTSDSDGREVTTANYYETIFKPWLDYLANFNVKILYNTPVESLKIDENHLSVYGTVDTNTGDDPTVYDYVIITSEVGAVQKIFKKTLQNYQTSTKISNLLSNLSNKYIGQMKIAPDYKILRVWFDKQFVNTTAPDILETPDYTPINLVAQYHQLEKEYIDWANRTGGSVMEFHCYTWSNYFDKNVTDDKVWELISPTVKLIYPEIFSRNFDILAYHVNSFQNFASFEQGLNKFRPQINSLVLNGLDKIYLAGDWIKTNFPSALMERAVSTGRLAANEILYRDHVRQVPLLVVNNKGPGV